MHRQLLQGASTGPLLRTEHLAQNMRPRQPTAAVQMMAPAAQRLLVMLPMQRLPAV